MEDGGLSIVTPLEYASNSTYQRYSGYDVLNINAVDVLTAAEYLSLIHISEPTRPCGTSRMPSSA